MMSRLSPLLALLAAAAVQPATAQERRAEIRPYIDASQVLSADIESGDVLTYSTLGVGLDATLQSRRVAVQVSYKYERRFDYDGALANNDSHSGLAQARIVVTPALSLEAGGLATRTRADIRGDAAVTGQGNVRNLSQVYSAYAGPNLAAEIGPASASAAYRIGYTRMDAPDGVGLLPGQAPLDLYDDSTVQVATASIGTRAGTVAPFGVSVSGSYTREDAGQLDQRFEGRYARADAIQPVSRSLAAVAGIGYERIEVSQRDPLRDGAGRPIVDGNGRFRTDPASPRRIAYDLDGIFWDAGVVWRPSRRTTLEARLGRRYGSMRYTGSFSHQFGPASGVQIGVYDEVLTYGQQVNGGLTRLPARFVTTADPFGTQFSGCVYGAEGSAAGNCLANIFASAPTSAYRARGVTGVAVLARGGSRIGLGGGYARRTFLAPSNATVAGVAIDGSVDETVYAELFASEQIDSVSALSTSVFASYYDSDLPGAPGILSWGANTAYTRSFGRLSATASLGAFGFEREDDISGSVQALLGVRYGF